MINGVEEEEQAGRGALQCVQVHLRELLRPSVPHTECGVSQEELKCLLYPCGLEKATLLYHCLQMLLKNTMARVLFVADGK